MSKPWDPAGGGMHSVGSSYERMVQKGLRIQKQCGTDRRKRPRFEKPETPVYVEGRRYTRKQLEYMADDILRRALSGPKGHLEEPAILLPEHYKDRVRREIYVGSGTPDPSILQGIYWRTHPEGRSAQLDPEKRRKSGASFYR